MSQYTNHFLFYFHSILLLYSIVYIHYYYLYSLLLSLLLSIIITFFSSLFSFFLLSFPSLSLHSLLFPFSFPSPPQCHRPLLWHIPTIHLQFQLATLLLLRPPRRPPPTPFFKWPHENTESNWDWVNHASTSRDH